MNFRKLPTSGVWHVMVGMQEFLKGKKLGYSNNYTGLQMNSQKWGVHTWVCYYLEGSNLCNVFCQSRYKLKKGWPAMMTPKLQLKKNVVIGKGNEAATTINQFNGDTKVPGKAGGKEHRNNKNNCNTCVKEGRSEWKMEASTATGTSSSWLTFFWKTNYQF